ncbi:MAG: tetratricopeptide repeat protein [Ktedonobacterales bacterium]
MNRMTYRGGAGGNMTVPGGPLGEARYALATGQADRAERILRKRLERQPSDPAARLLLAQSLLQQQQIPDAITESRRVTREQPNNADAYLILSAGLLQQSSGPLARVPAEAESAARKAVQLQPKLARARVQLAEALAANNDLVGARIAADEAIKLEPRGPSGYFIRAVVLLREKDYEGAIQACDSALRYDKDHQLAQAEFIKANALMEAKRYDEALASLNSAERQNPLLGGAAGNGMRGRIYFRQRKFRQSYDQFNAAALQSGRKRLAPVTAFISMIYSPFGERAQYAILITVMVLLALIIFGLSLIPVAGPWISGLVIAAIVGVLAYTGLRMTQGSILPKAGNARFISLLGIIAAGLVGFVLAAIIERVLAGLFTKHPGFYDLTPTNLTIAVCVGLIAAAVAGYGIPLLLARSQRKTAVAR